jgi:hypothetical protein
MIEIADIGHVDVGAQLAAAKDPDLLVHDGMGGQDIDRKIEPHPLGIAADRGGPNGHADEVVRLVLEQQRLAEALVLVVIRDRQQGMILGHLRLVGHAVDRAGGRVDEALHPCGLGGDHHGLETVEIDRFGQARIEDEARVVRDARKVDHRVAALHRLCESRRIAQIALDGRDLGMVGHALVTEELDIEDHDLIARLQQNGGQNRTDITGAAGHQNALDLGLAHCHSPT